MSVAATRSDTQTTESPSSPAEEAGALLRRLLFAERRRFFDAASEFELHPAQAGALTQLDEHSGSPMHEIASHLACDSSNVTGLVDGLAAQGLVERREAEHDRRVRMLVVTERGQAVRDRFIEVMSEVPDPLARLGEGDQVLLRDVLQRALG